MEYKGGTSWYDYEKGHYVSKKRIYSDFYCSLDEWRNLGRGKENFMYQLRSKLVAHGLITKEEHEDVGQTYLRKNEDTGKFETAKLWDGTIEYKLSFDRTGRRDGLETENYSAHIIKEAIKLITRRDAEVEFFSWKGTIDHVEISFPGCEMPNIIVLIDAYCPSSTNDTLIGCIDAIYESLYNKKLKRWYEEDLAEFYNQDYDRIYTKSLVNENKEYTEWEGKTYWKEIFKKKKYREYTHYGHISYKK